MPPPRFIDQIGELFGVLQQAPGPVHVRIWQELGPWLRNLSVEAPIKWVQRLAANQPCHVVARADGRCKRPACAACIACGQATCLGHAFINGSGEAICFVCATATLRPNARRDPQETLRQDRIRAKELAWARRQLRVTAATDWDVIRAAHRKLSAKWHPDRYRSEGDRAKAEAKFKEVQRAFDLLQKERERAAA